MNSSCLSGFVLKVPERNETTTANATQPLGELFGKIAA